MDMHPTHQPAKTKPTQPNPTQQVGLGRFLGVDGLGWVGLGYNFFFFNSGLGWFGFGL